VYTKCVKRQQRQLTQKSRGVQETNVEKCTQKKENLLEGIENETTNKNGKINILRACLFGFFFGGGDLLKKRGSAPLRSQRRLYNK